ncbi:MAG TPA: hypothetical protein VEK76_13480 [Candidatus Binatia bacterium]|nr:hypothetical protein [Candidatus Binatia bacterium]
MPYPIAEPRLLALPVDQLGPVVSAELEAVGKLIPEIAKGQALGAVEDTKKPGGNRVGRRNGHLAREHARGAK